MALAPEMPGFYFRDHQETLPHPAVSATNDQLLLATFPISTDNEGSTSFRDRIVNPDYTDITLVLDRSGSMQEIRDDTIGGFNGFVADQQQVDKKCTLTLVQFDSQDPREVVYDAVPINRVVPLTAETFVPRASTPLYDAIGQTIVKTGERLAALPEPARPGHVVFVILTDGLENSSREYSRERIIEMIGEQQSRWNWHFVYLGANQDGMAEGGRLGIDAAHSATFAFTSAGTDALYRHTGENLRKMRLGERDSMAYDDEQRRDMEQE